MAGYLHVVSFFCIFAVGFKRISILRATTKADTSKWRPALKAAFPYTVPIFAGYWFLGLTYGILMNVSGFSFVWPMVMATVIFSGSVEFVAVKVLLSSFHPLQAFVMAFMIGARHLFYGISMLDRFKHKGWKKPLLIYFMSDETFSVNYTAKVPKGIDDGWFMLWVSLLDFLYWLSGATLGGIFGNLITFSTKGLDFVMTAMFVVIFVEQWMKDKRHVSAVLGVVLSVVSLLVFGPDNFVIPAMVLMLLALIVLRQKLDATGDSADDDEATALREAELLTREGKEDRQ